MIYSGVPHMTAALVMMRDISVGKDQKTIIYIPDESLAISLEKIGELILRKSIYTITHASELFALDRVEEDIILLSGSLLRLEGNLESIKRAHTTSIRQGDHYSQNDLIEKLLELGYTQSSYSGELGTYSREGSIIRITIRESEWMIEYYGDEIESIIEHRRDTHTHHDHLTIGRYHTRGYPGESLDTAIHEGVLSLLIKYQIILISCEFSREREWFHIHASDIIEYSSLAREGSISSPISRLAITKVEELKGYLLEEKEVTIYTRYEKKVREFLEINSLSHTKIIATKHTIESLEIENIKSSEGEIKNSAIIGDDILSKIFIEDRVRKSSIKHLDLLLALKEGDLVVHREHGIGRYIALTRKRIGLTEREYMEILYAKDARIYLPLTELGRITKYVGEEGTSLSDLEGKEWERTMSRTEEETERIAREILETDARRKLATRIPFAKFREEEEIFLKAFKYTHTPDQLAIIREIRDDMEASIPMDRLVSGDVGFGKTEVAMHSIYKAVLSGMQVAVISPLLILAEEHRETFLERLGAFGVRIASLTRMTKSKDEKIILEKMRKGEIDVIVGTHRLLSEDIHFRRLGLLIIDEEHRFGVAHKEAIKKMKSHIDILSLSATPIPRSLNLTLSGLKKISLLTTPPPAKKPIETIVARWDEMMIASAIEHELARGGQVIILHNRIRALPMIEKEIQEILIGVKGRNSEYPKIITTHGQMNAEEIENRILDFKAGKYDILLTTTIIENGVNFLGANTIIVSDAEEFGLAQLHQIRGRVGRKDIGGTCYLLYRKYELSTEERERLMVLAEHSSLGSGYEIAMRDMQIRGTGDILGFRQSGKSKEVGISLYFQLLEEKVTYLKTGKESRTKTKIELELSYSLPPDYFDSDIDKLSFFREIEAIETLEDLDRTEEIYSEPVLSDLFLMTRTQIILGEYGVTKVSKLGVNYHFDFASGTTPAKLRAFLDRFDKKSEMIIVSVTKIRIEISHWKDVRGFLESLITS